MLVPLSVGRASTAQLVDPLLRPLGFAPRATAMTPIAGAPPAGANLQAPIEPGSVLSIPLAYGDLDLSGAGTVTDVLPDGPILAFGHAMFAQGRTALPLATGYIHFVSSRKNLSFKVSSSMNIVGSILRDENSAVAGNHAMAFATAPLNVSVAYPDQPPRDYSYTVVDHPMLTPVIAAICSIQSVTAVRDLPLRNTMRVEADMTFTGDRAINLSTVIPMAMGDDVAYQVLPVIASAMQNPFEQLKLESMETRVTIEPEVRMAALLGARLEKRVVEPGATVKVTAEIQPYNQPVQTVRGELTVPADTPEGDYALLLGDAQTYINLFFSSRPHLTQITDTDELFDAMRQMLAIRNDALYLTLMLTEKGIAVGRNEMPQLPSSRRAMIATPTSTVAMPYLESVDQMIPLGLVIQGQQQFLISVRKPHSEIPINDI